MTGIFKRRNITIKRGDKEMPEEFFICKCYVTSTGGQVYSAVAKVTPRNNYPNEPRTRYIRADLCEMKKN